MRRELLIAEVARTVWAIEPSYGQRVSAVLARWNRGESASEADLREMSAAREDRSSRRMQTAPKGGIAVLPLVGVIAPKANLITEFSGGTSCQTFTMQLREAVDDPAVAQILIDGDSPGGSVSGVPELASEIMQARIVKPVIGLANHCAASACYWLMSCCTELYVTPSGSVGSIGVYTMHQDISEALKREGISNDYVSAGKYKLEGRPDAPLDPTARDYMQSQVNEFYRMFTAAVARGRGASVDAVRNGFGEGRMVMAQQAKALGMVDGVADLLTLVGDMQKRPRSVKGGGAKALALAGPLNESRQRAHNRRELEILSL